MEPPLEPGGPFQNPFCCPSPTLPWGSSSSATPTCYSPQVPVLVNSPRVPTPTFPLELPPPTVTAPLGGRVRRDGRNRLRLPVGGTGRVDTGTGSCEVNGRCGGATKTKNVKTPTTSFV